MRLEAFLNGRRAGVVEVSLSGPVFTYDSDWIVAARKGAAHALSASMPMTRYDHGPDVAGPFLDGLLPEEKPVREALATALGLSPGASSVELLRVVGRDCAGSVTFLDGDNPHIQSMQQPRIQRLATAELASALRDLRSRPFGVDRENAVRTVLAGSGNKLPVVIAGGTPALSLNGFPTSHILKIDRAGVRDEIKAENYCLKLAAACGIKTVSARIDQVEDVTYLSVARYDRKLHRRDNGAAVLLRVHQEDINQATATAPDRKYEADGAPGWDRFGELAKLTARPAAEQAALVDRAIFTYLIDHREGHAKNNALLYSHAGGGSEVAPLYDLTNAASLRAMGASVRQGPAMSLGSDRKASEGAAGGFVATPDHWADFASTMGMPASYVAGRVRELSERLSAVAISERDLLRGTLGDSPILDVILEDVQGRVDPSSRPRASMSAAAGPSVAPATGPKFGY